MSQFPKDPQPRDVVYTGKASTTYGRDYFEAQSAVDWLGNRFHVGEVVMYCIGAGRGQMMAFGTVLRIRYYPTTQTIRRDARDDEGPSTPGYREFEYNGETRRHVWEKLPKDDVEVQVKTFKTSGWEADERSKPAWPNSMNITALPFGIPSDTQ